MSELKEAPKVTAEDVEKVICKQDFFRPTGTLTICVLTLDNGFTVTGESACISPENFDETKGRQLAREQAFKKVWTLEAYALAERIHRNYPE